MKNIFILAVVILCVSCTNVDQKKEATLVEATCNVFLKNNAGENILGTSKYPENIIIVKYLIGGKEFGYGYDTPGAILDNPQGFYTGIVSPHETGKGMRVFLNADPSEEYPVTYLRWNETEVDTLKAKYRRGSGNNGAFVVLEKLWLNDVLVWRVEVEGQTTQDITIVK